MQIDSEQNSEAMLQQAALSNQKQQSQIQEDQDFTSQQKVQQEEMKEDFQSDQEENTAILKVREDQEQDMVIDSQPAQIENPSTKETSIKFQSSGKREVIFRSLDSKLALAHIFGYAFSWDQTWSLMKLLSKKSLRYFEQYNQNFRYFIHNHKIRHVSLIFGDRITQFIRPKIDSVVEKLEFAYITSNLYQAEEFSKQTHRIETLSVGNRGFKIFTDAKLDQMVGLDLPYTVECKDSDRGNLRTLVNLLKVTRILELNRMSVTWPILHILVHNPSSFSNIRGLSLEFSAEHKSLLEAIPEEILANIFHLTLVEPPYFENEGEFEQTCNVLLSKTQKLKSLSISPSKSDVDWIKLLQNHSGKFSQLQNLNITANVTLSGTAERVPLVPEEIQPEKDVKNLESYLEKMQPIVESEMTKLKHQILEENAQIGDFYAKITSLSTGKQEIILSKVVERELLNHRDFFKFEMPNLQRFQVATGYFSMKSLQLFPPLKQVWILCHPNPETDDLFTEEQLIELEDVNIAKISEEYAKDEQLFKQLVRAQNLQRLQMTLSSPKSQSAVKIFINNMPSKLQELTLNGIKTERFGISFLGVFGKMSSLKKLSLNFQRIFPDDIIKNYKEDTFPYRSNTTLKSLSISQVALSIQQKKMPSKIWLSFFGMFSNLTRLSIRNQNLTQFTHEEMTQLISGQSNLKSLQFSHIKMEKAQLSALANLLTSQSSKLEDLVFMPQTLAKKDYEELILGQILHKNRTLKSISVFMVEFDGNSLCDTLLALSRHPTLETVSFQSAKGYLDHNDLIKIQKLLLQMHIPNHNQGNQCKVSDLQISFLANSLERIQPLLLGFKQKIVANVLEKVPQLHRFKF